MSSGVCTGVFVSQESSVIALTYKDGLNLLGSLSFRSWQLQNVQDLESLRLKRAPQKLRPIVNSCGESFCNYQPAITTEKQMLLVCTFKSDKNSNEYSVSQG